jgi:hypothetical protein
MNFKFDDKEYDSDKLSDAGKLYFNKLKLVQSKKNNLVFEFSDIQILEKHYTDLLKNEISKDDKKEEVKKENKK